jgi:hypothetical protein
MSQRTTVYMVFVPTNFWNTASGTGPFNGTWFGSLAFAAKTAATNLCDKQLTGYTFIGQGRVGDQPGRHTWHYLAEWQNLPDGTFIAQRKFSAGYPITDLISGRSFPISQFAYTNNIPFPTEANTPANTPTLPSLPYIAFNSFGQLASGRDEYIPLAHGSVAPVVDPSNKRPVMSGSPSVTELPAGNSTNLAYNIVHIDALTGRAVLEFHKLGP